jgi:hypothetical protein
MVCNGGKMKIKDRIMDLRAVYSSYSVVQTQKNSADEVRKADNVWA